jgi:hypothetical protein
MLQILPSVGLTYRLLLSSNALSLSRMCGLLATCRRYTQPHSLSTEPNSLSTEPHYLATCRRYTHPHYLLPLHQL